MFPVTTAGRYLFPKVLYLAEEGYLLYRNGKIEKADPNSRDKVSLVVLAKKYYFESLKKFPFSSMKDIKSAVSLDLPSFSPFTTDLLFVRKIEQTDEGTKVNLWFIDGKIAERLKALSPLFIVPESAFLSLPGGDGPRIYTISGMGEKRLFVHIGAHGSIKSMTSERDSLDLISFRRLIDVERDACPVTRISGMEEYFSFIRKIANEMPIRRLSPFLNLKALSFQSNRRTIKWGLGTAATIVALYLVFSIAMPYFVLNRLQEENKALSKGLSSLLKKEEMIERYHGKQEKLADKINSYTYKTAIISRLGRLLPKGARIWELRISGNRVEIRGAAPKASDLLAALSRGKGVGNAMFTSPLREDSKTRMEAFTVTFIYRLPGAKPENGGGELKK